jgi:hypothetical protein
VPILKAGEIFATKWEVMVYGSPGVGKTSLFAHAPNVLYIETDDNGYIVLQPHQERTDLTVFYTRSWIELAGFIKALPTSNLIKSVDVIVVDTISECQWMQRLHQIGGDPLADEKWRFNESVYAVNNFKIQALVRAIKQCNKSVAWLCHETTDLVGKDSQEKLIRPALSPSLLSAVQAGLDGQFYFRRDGMNRILETDGTGQVQTKSRFQKSRSLVNPTWETISELVTSRMKHS